MGAKSRMRRLCRCSAGSLTRVTISSRRKVFIHLTASVGSRWTKENSGENKMAEKNGNEPLVAVIMGSQSDWETMRHADETLTQFGVAHECRVISAHRSPSLAAEFGSTAESRRLEVVIAAAGGAAHLAGVLAAHTTLPVLGVPMKSDALNGLDSLLATVQMLSLIHISEPTRLLSISYAVFCL